MTKYWRNYNNNTLILMYAHRHTSSFNKLFLYCISSDLKFVEISRKPHKRSHGGSCTEGFPIYHQMMLLVALKIKTKLFFLHSWPLFDEFECNLEME